MLDRNTWSIFWLGVLFFCNSYSRLVNVIALQRTCTKSKLTRSRAKNTEFAG